MRSVAKYPVNRCRCVTCRRDSDYTHISEQEGWSNRFGWATCAECAVVVDPDHPDEPPVVPFPLPGSQS